MKVAENPMESGVDIELAKRQCTAADMQASRFFASHAWTGTHEGQDFGKTSFGILNSARTGTYITQPSLRAVEMSTTRLF